ncbi:MAG: hypothetical protein HY790_07035 [Deltaproteobacteria bacterium]|nr:hypothetical protein [Deltaproteobacteria bacterium]
MLPTVKFFLIMLIFTLMASFFIVPTRTMPDHAIVLLDDQSHTYLSPACASREKKEYRVSRAAEARKLKYEPDQKCGGETGFTQDGRSITGNFLERMGMLPPLPSRWNPDGTWNW